MTQKASMVHLAKEYLAHRRNLGYQLRTEGKLLLHFAHYADRLGHRGPVTLDLAVGWARLPQGAAPWYWARRLSIVRAFARHRAIFDPDTEIPPRGFLGPTRQRTCPHIYSDDDLAALLAAMRQLAPRGGLRPRTYVALFGLLICTGLRIAEALRLSRQDVDLRQGILTIRETKFYKSRLVPLHPSATQALADYACFRDRKLPLVKASTFFLSKHGARLTYWAVRSQFRRLLDRLGWDRRPGGRLPRIHDLRHTFTCNRLLLWYQQDVDVDHAILALSTYLGHSQVSHTYWYVTGIPELLAIAASRFVRFTSIKPGAR